LNERKQKPLRLRLKASSLAHVLVILLFLVLPFIFFRPASGISSPDQNEQPYPSGSWAFGVVVPENSQFADGGRLSWENATAVNVVIRLPNMSFTDSPTLAVESVMATDSAILQVAAGLYPYSTTWLAYGWYIRNLQGYPQTYEWVLNSSKPEMAAASWVSLSIYLSSGHWRYRVEDLSTHDAMSGEYAFDVAPALMVGDQEVFALESYSTSNAVFAHMGDMILKTLDIDGRKVSGGWYPYGSWDPSHKPLFVVGGLSPPSYISLGESENKTLEWSYEQWSTSAQATSSNGVLTPSVAVPAAAALGVTILVFAVKKRKKR
jgi:hypothetical protein